MSFCFAYHLMIPCGSREYILLGNGVLSLMLLFDRWRKWGLGRKEPPQILSLAGCRVGAGITLLDPCWIHVLFPLLRFSPPPSLLCFSVPQGRSGHGLLCHWAIDELCWSSPSVRPLLSILTLTTRVKSLNDTTSCGSSGRQGLPGTALCVFCWLHSELSCLLRSHNTS